LLHRFFSFPRHLRPAFLDFWTLFSISPSILPLRANQLLNLANCSSVGVGMTGDGTAQVLPTVTGFAAKQAIPGLRKHHTPTAALLHRAGLSGQEFAAGDVRSLNHHAGILFYVASGAKDLGDALTLFERYFRIVNEAVHLKLVRAPQGVVVEVNFV